MAKRKSSKSVTLTQEDVVFGALGALGGLAINGVLNQALANVPDASRQTIAKVIPFAKVLGGGYLAMQGSMDRRLRFAGLGFAGTGALEAGIKFAPQYFSIQGTGDLYSLIGNSSVVRLPIQPASSIDPVSDKPFIEEEVLGVEYDDMLL